MFVSKYDLNLVIAEMLKEMALSFYVNRKSAKIQNKTMLLKKKMSTCFWSIYSVYQGERICALSGICR